ncbi:MAG: hypothetical protein IPL50_08240 [Chitinophagaceae bacterium]|nr:hypothetical protein [Chitinophagaceae bacterium]
MKKIIFFILIGLFVAETDSHAQFSRYIIRLKDKGTNPFTLATQYNI